MHVDGARFHINIVAPHVFEQKLARKNLARRFHQHFQQTELGRPQVNIFVAAKNFFLRQIHPNIFKHQFFLRQQFGRAAQVGLYPGHQLRHRKRLGYIVVRTGRQAFDFVFFFAFGGQHDNRNVFNVRFVAYHFADFHSRKFGQHPVEQNNRRTIFFHRRQSLVARRLQRHFKTLFFKIVFQEQSQSFFVFHHQYQSHAVFPPFSVFINFSARRQYLQHNCRRQRRRCPPPARRRRLLGTAAPFPG